MAFTLKKVSVIEPNKDLIDIIKTVQKQNELILEAINRQLGIPPQMLYTTNEQSSDTPGESG